MDKFWDMAKDFLDISFYCIIMRPMFTKYQQATEAKKGKKAKPDTKR